MRIPDCIRIDDYHWSIAALIEATGFVDADLFLQTARSDLLPQIVNDRVRAFTGAGLA